MASVFSFPFRLGPDGSIATVDDSSDTAIDEAIAIALLTRPGERIQAPTFGIADPAFAGVEAGALQRHLQDFGPDVTITALTSAVHPGERRAITVTWDRLDTTLSVGGSV